MMKVSELIEDLKSYNQDAEITLTNSETICLSYICKDRETGQSYDKSSTPIVFVEPRDLCPLCTSEYMDGDIMMCSSYDKPCREVEECYQFEEFDE